MSGFDAKRTLALDWEGENGAKAFSWKRWGSVTCPVQRLASFTKYLTEQAFPPSGEPNA